MKLFDIWDIDNCVADDLWRQPLIDYGKTGDDRYRDYNSRLEEDAVCHLAEFNLFRKMGSTPVFITGRSEYLRESTYRWQYQGLGVVQPIMYMRPNNSLLTPARLKEALLTRFFYEHMGFGNRVIAAFDDLESVVKMYRDHNIPAAVLAIHADVNQVYAATDHL